MKKVVSVALAFIMVLSCVFAFAGCSKNDGTYDLVLITDGSTITDKGHNQSAWDGVKSFGDENNMTYRYYQPNVDESGELSIDTIEKYIDLAVNDGAKYIVLPGEDFAVAAYEYAPTYNKVNFILVDAFPHSQDDKSARFQSNVMCITFNQLQAGFLAGYASVADGYTKLGYLGSVNSATSGNYGAGFVQGAAYAADETGTPVILDYADYDSAILDYDYSFTIKPVYQKVEEAAKETFKVNVVGGIGSGVYTDGENVTITADSAPEGKVFDHWEVKSDTQGVKDKKVNISSKNKSSMNLLVGDCDCTITAVWADAATVPVIITEADGKTAHETIYPEEHTNAWITAPSAQPGMVFDHWEANDESIFEDASSSSTNVSVSDQSVTVVPVYIPSENPTFMVTVENGTGSGSYVAGDQITLVADPPKDGYMFYKWENVDNQGLSTGIAMENEYCYSTTFEMVDRYASIVEKMYDDGTQVVFGGGNPLSDSIFTATWSFDYQVYAFGSGVDESSKGNCLASVVTDYGAALKLALADYKGGSIFMGDCSNQCIYVTGKSIVPTYTDDDGNEQQDKNYNEGYANAYEGLAKGKIATKNVQSGADVRLSYSSKCLTLNYWIKTT
ncbi:MAG: BMP family ABC transporter substrate-binding protein [Eubacterium sp.]